MTHTVVREPGNVKRYNALAGLGAIEINGEPDVLLTRQDLLVGIGAVAEGEPVEFERTGERTSRAGNVVPLG